MEGSNQNQASHELPERSHSSRVNSLPNELLLEIFDFYRLNQDEDYWECWKRKFRWFRLTHVCRRWRCVVLAWFSRLDVTLLVTNNNPGHIKTIFSHRLAPLPIVIDYTSLCDKTTKDLGRVLAALKRCDRVRGITFRGTSGDFDKCLKATKRPFPSLQSLELREKTAARMIYLPTTFLGGSVSKLRRLSLHGVSAPLSMLLSTSATTLLDLHLGIGTFDPFQGMLLFACLRGMLCLCRLELETQTHHSFTYPTETEPIVPLPNLTRFHFYGPCAFLDAFAARFAAPSLQDVNIGLNDFAWFPIPHLTRFISDLKKRYRSVQVILEGRSFRLSLLTCSESIDCAEPHFRFYSNGSQESLLRMCSVFSAELATVEELFLFFSTGAVRYWDPFPWPKWRRAGR
ncbi:hypothetical protein BC826DRAFT_658724 [Russula brevipes]|nr:hypothetical protein BC826DRAFT_658724 [Russula brevipes]